MLLSVGLALAIFFPLMSSVPTGALLLFSSSLVVISLVWVMWGPWYAGILFLIYISGILVVFSYMLGTTNNPNEVAYFLLPLLVVSMLPHEITLSWGSSDWEGGVEQIFATEGVLLYSVIVIFLFVCLVAVATLCTTQTPLRGHLWAL